MVNYYTYLVLFLDEINKSISLSEFSKHFKRPHQTMKAHLQKLAEENVLIADKRERFLFYRLNKENPLTYEYIAICEKERLFEFLKKEIFKRVYLALKHYDAKMLIFGSAVNDARYKDIDLLVLSKDSSIRDAVKKLELTYSVKIHLLMTEEKNLTETFKKELQKKHIILNGHEYFVKMLYP